MMKNVAVGKRLEVVLELGRWGRLLGWSLAGACVLTYASLWGRAGWNLRAVRNAFASQKAEARRLGLTYDAVSAAPYALTNKPVLWTLGRTGRQWYYHGDNNKPVEFLNQADPPTQGRHGMEEWTVLAIVRGGGPKGVFLEFLRID